MIRMLKYAFGIAVLISCTTLSIQVYQWRKEVQETRNTYRQKLCETKYHVQQMNKANRILDELLIKKHQAE